MVRVFLSLLICLSISVFSLADASVTEITSSQFQTVSQKANDLAKIYGSSHVLIVFDIDNTLLAMNQSLGSDQWFNWQDGLLKKDAKSSDLVSNNFSGLLNVQGLLFDLSKMHLTEKDIPLIVNKLRKNDYPMVVVTARGNDFAKATLNALKANSLNFDHAFKVSVPSCQYAPYTLNNLKINGLTKKDLMIAHIENQKPRAVLFTDGVLFGSGQNKGILVKTLLANASDQIKAIVFVDDSQSNVSAFNQMMAPSGIDVISIRYSKEDNEVKAFDQSNKKEVIAQWQKLSKTLNEVFK